MVGGSGTKQFFTADASGNFSITGISSGPVVITAGQWGYVTKCANFNLPAPPPLIIALDKGYYDDFAFDFGWTVSSACVAGDWERGVPIGTGAAIWFNPNEDDQTDCSDECFVTLNVGGNPVLGDLDDGYTDLVSPVMDLTAYADPYIHYARWFVNTNANPANADTLLIRLDDGTGMAVAEQVYIGMTPMSQWVAASFRVSDFIVPGPSVILSVFAEDKVGSGSTLECGFDHFFVTEGPLALEPSGHPAGEAALFPNPAGHSVVLTIPAAAGTPVRVEIAGVTGKTVYRKWHAVSAEGRATIDVSPLSKGMYIVTATAGKNVFVRKMLKQ
jgi:hypothetical protein